MVIAFFPKVLLSGLLTPPLGTFSFFNQPEVTRAECFLSLSVYSVFFNKTRLLHMLSPGYFLNQSFFCPVREELISVSTPGH